MILPKEIFKAIFLFYYVIHFEFNDTIVSEWLLFNANSAIFSYIMARTSYFHWDDDEVGFVLDQRAELDFIELAR